MMKKDKKKEKKKHTKTEPYFDVFLFKNALFNAYH